MKTLRRILLYGALIVSLFFYWKIVYLSPCDTLIKYDIGAFDDRFRISEDQLLTQIQLAELPWEDVAGKELFRYVPGADFKINLIFSEEQERTYEGDDLQQNLNTQEDSIDSIQTRYESAVSRHQRAVRDYETKKAQYEKDVAYWNSRGGAPQSQYQSLNSTAQSLNRKVVEINNLVNLVNSLAQKSNQQIGQYNSGVGQYNNLFDGREFDAGDTDGSEINIYSYSDRNELRSLLIHEFGHVLGVDHVEDTASIMYYLLNEENEGGELSNVDIEALQVSCRL